MSYLVGLYYNVILTWCIYYLWESFSFELPWTVNFYSEFFKPTVCLELSEVREWNRCFGMCALNDADQLLLESRSNQHLGVGPFPIIAKLGITSFVVCFRAITGQCAAHRDNRLLFAILITSHWAGSARFQRDSHWIPTFHLEGPDLGVQLSGNCCSRQLSTSPVKIWPKVQEGQFSLWFCLGGIAIRSVEFKLLEAFRPTYALLFHERPV